jgi:hypothetical protein
MRTNAVAVALGLLLTTGAALAQQPAVFRAKPPEITGVNSWINSKPLTLAALKGQVVVLHFWTFG